MRSKISITAVQFVLVTSLILICVANADAGPGSAGSSPISARSSEPVCDASADYFLGMEDYGEAIATHRRLLGVHPSDALAHYHLGFAYGMTGDRSREITEYRRAAALGLREWDLYLNLGRALLEDGKLTAATAALNRAVALAPERPEAHFNLGLTYERNGMLTLAQAELERSLRLDPRQPDARNMMGLIYAEEHDYSHARQVWDELARTEPDFEPARINLAILDHVAAPKVRAPADRNTLRTAFVYNSH